MRRRLIFWLTLLSVMAGSGAGAQELPNIVLILADDLGYGDPGCYNKHSKIPTPHMDQLAAEGRRFTDAHSPSSVCTPTRYGILTGRYAWRTVLQKSVLWPWDPPLIKEERWTLPEMLRQANYHTACIGKWHLGWNWKNKSGETIQTNLPAGHYDATARATLSRSVDFNRPIEGGPIRHGFDYYFGDDVPNFPPYVFIENDHTLGIPTVDKPPDMFGNPGLMLAGWDLSQVMPALTQKACQYISARQSKEEPPFFLYLSLTAPHTPIAPSPHFIGKSAAGWYGDFVAQVDWTLGQVMQSLERNGLRENTLVIFTSDNGSPQRDGTHMHGETGSVKQFGHDPSFPWRGMKSDIWEGGHRVPFIVSWPGKTPPGTISTEPLILTDLMQTLAHVIGADLPTNAAEDSYNMLPVLLGDTVETPIREVLVHHSGNGMFAIRQGHWKLILGKESGGFTKYTPPVDAPKGQLYNLATDPREENNLYLDHPEKVQALEAKLKAIKAQGAGD